MKKKTGGKADLMGPLYNKGDGHELGPHRVEGPRGGIATPDPIGFGHGKLRKGPGGRDYPEHHEKD